MPEDPEQESCPLNTQQHEVLNNLARRIYELLKEDKILQELRGKLPEVGLQIPLLFVGANVLVRVESENQKRVFSVSPDGEVTFSQEDIKEFQRRFNISLDGSKK